MMLNALPDAMPYGDLAVALAAADDDPDAPIAYRAAQGVDRLGGPERVRELSERWRSLNTRLIRDGDDAAWEDEMRNSGLDPHRLAKVVDIDWARLPRP